MALTLALVRGTRTGPGRSVVRLGPRGAAARTCPGTARPLRRQPPSRPARGPHGEARGAAPRPLRSMASDEEELAPLLDEPTPSSPGEAKRGARGRKRGGASNLSHAHSGLRVLPAMGAPEVSTAPHSGAQALRALCGAPPAPPSARHV